MPPIPTPPKPLNRHSLTPLVHSTAPLVAQSEANKQVPQSTPWKSAQNTCSPTHNGRTNARPAGPFPRAQQHCAANYHRHRPGTLSAAPSCRHFGRVRRTLRGRGWWSVAHISEVQPRSASMDSGARRYSDLVWHLRVTMDAQNERGRIRLTRNGNGAGDRVRERILTR